MMHHILPAAAITIIVLSAAVLLLGGTNAGVWALNVYARLHGGTWHQARFECPGCGKRCHVGRPGPAAATLCLHCSPAPRPGGTR